MHFSVPTLPTKCKILKIKDLNIKTLLEVVGNTLESVGSCWKSFFISNKFQQENRQNNL